MIGKVFEGSSSVMVVSLDPQGNSRYLGPEVLGPQSFNGSARATEFQ